MSELSPKDGAAVVKNTTAPREKAARVQAVQAPPGRVTSSFVVKQLVVDGLLSAADAERFKTTGGQRALRTSAGGAGGDELSVTAG